MQANKENFKINAGVGTGEALQVDRYTFKSVHVIPDGGNYSIDVSLDGTNWINLITNISVDKFYTTEDSGANVLPTAVNFLRIVTNVAGGAPSVVLFGHDPA